MDERVLLNCISESSRVWAREQDKKDFYWINISTLAGKIEKGSHFLVRTYQGDDKPLLGVEKMGYQKVYEIKTLSGASITLCEHMHLLVGKDWIRVHNIKSNYKITEYAILSNKIKETGIADFYYVGEQIAYRLSIKDEPSCIVNGIYVLF